MHDKPPLAATQVIHLYGGPNDGETWSIPMDAHAFELEEVESVAVHLYHYSSVASALFKRTTFISQHIENPPQP